MLLILLSGHVYGLKRNNRSRGKYQTEKKNYITSGRSLLICELIELNMNE